MDPIPLFSLQTRLGAFHIEADPVILEITYDPPGAVYALRNDLHPWFARAFTSPYDAIRAVAGHRTTLPEWDELGVKVSDYAGDWVRHVDGRIQMRLLDAFLTARPDAGMRELVDFIEQRYPFIMDRLVIKELFIGLAMSGQLASLPDMRLAPAELRNLPDRVRQFVDLPHADG